VGPCTSFAAPATVAAVGSQRWWLDLTWFIQHRRWYCIKLKQVPVRRYYGSGTGIWYAAQVPGRHFVFTHQVAALFCVNRHHGGHHLESGMLNPKSDSVNRCISLLLEQSCQIPFQSNLKQGSLLIIIILGRFWRQSPRKNNNNNEMSSDMLFFLFTDLFARYSIFIQLFGYPAASVFNKLSQSEITSSSKNYLKTIKYKINIHHNCYT